MRFFVAHTLPQFAYIRLLFALRTASEARPPWGRADSQRNRSPGDPGHRLHILIRLAQMVLEPDDVAEPHPRVRLGGNAGTVPDGRGAIAAQRERTPALSSGSRGDLSRTLKKSINIFRQLP
jgi:hypothetical protein